MRTKRQQTVPFAGAPRADRGGGRRIYASSPLRAGHRAQLPRSQTKPGAAVRENTSKGRHRIEIVDVFKSATAALKHHVLVTPTLMVVEPRLGVTLLGKPERYQTV